MVEEIQIYRTPYPTKEKPTCAEASVGEGGERDSAQHPSRTPGPVTVNGFSKGSCGQDRRIRPLRQNFVSRLLKLQLYSLNIFSLLQI